MPHAFWECTELDGRTRACPSCGYNCSRVDELPSGNQKWNCGHCNKSKRGPKHAFACYNHNQTPRYICDDCGIPACGVCWSHRPFLESVELAVCKKYHYFFLRNYVHIYHN